MELLGSHIDKAAQDPTIFLANRALRPIIINGRVPDRARCPRLLAGIFLKGGIAATVCSQTGVCLVTILEVGGRGPIWRLTDRLRVESNARGA